ncbi:MAG: hypothetical protein GVY13_11900 [Alphaproteobacteria bacterium]|jgi:hypothetical protein|nr:hypothetical protein [Alphaproteobacteria bacterium]
MPHDPGLPDPENPADGAALLERAFIEGFRAAGDRASFLRLAGVPLEAAIDGVPGFKLMEVRIIDSIAVGAANPGFGTAGLVYHPYPAALMRQATTLTFVYRTAREVRELGWPDLATVTSQ